MAYKKCEWCPKTLNGDYRTQIHEEKEHPRERALRWARLEVARNTTYLEMAKLEVERLADYQAAMEMTDLPLQVRVLVQRELDRYYHRDDMRPSLAWSVEDQTQALAESQARLAELEAKAPVAAMP